MDSPIDSPQPARIQQAAAHMPPYRQQRRIRCVADEPPSPPRCSGSRPAFRLPQWPHFLASDATRQNPRRREYRYASLPAFHPRIKPVYPEVESDRSVQTVNTARETLSFPQRGEGRERRRHASTAVCPGSSISAKPSHRRCPRFLILQRTCDPARIDKAGRCVFDWSGSSRFAGLACIAPTLGRFCQPAASP
jgi:hypothetical protein